MDTVISAQSDLLEQIKRAQANFKKTPKDRLNINYTKTKLQLLEDIWGSIRTNHINIIQSVDKKTLISMEYSTRNVYFTAEDEYTSAKVLMMDTIEQLQEKTKSSRSGFPSSSESVKPAEVKIPALKIPSFSGMYTEWYSFHDQFVSLIHNNQALTNVQKLHYLKMHVLGEAANLLRNIPVTDKNYDHAWEKLKKRFSNKRVIVNAYLHKLMSIRTIVHQSANAIKYLLDTTLDCLNGLSSADVKIGDWDTIIIYLTVNKLDSESNKQWEEKVTRDNDDSLPTLQMLTEFLESKFRSLEGIQSSRVNNIRPRQNINTVEKKVYHTTKTTTSKETCSYCKNGHYLHKCQQFATLNYDEKKNFIEKNQLCYNCLVPYHGIKQCRHPARCHSCGKKHHSLIHPPPENINEINTAYTSSHRRETSNNFDNHIQSTETNKNEEVISYLATKQKTNVLLATAMVKVRAENGRELQLRALIDQGSEGSFITESATQTLGLKRKTINGSISGIGDTQALKTNYIVRFMLQSNTEKQFKLCVDAYVLRTLTRLLPSKHVSSNWTHIQGLPLADSTYSTPGKIDLLLGAAVYSRILQSGVKTGPPGTPLAQKTQLGWILSGEVNINHTETEKTILSMHITNIEDENKLLKKFWEIESEEACKQTMRMTEEELKCENIYERTHKRDKTGRYIVDTLIKDKDYDYGNTKDRARKRLEQIERKLNKDKELKEEYTKVLMEYKDLGHMEEIDENEINKSTKEIFYLPHHAVVKGDKLTSRLRVVFDASMKGSNGSSLNDNMFVGPKIQRDLRHIVMTWREHKVALVADCVKMYRQIKVTKECANLQRILWRHNGELKEYKLTRVTFGTASAPYLATKTIQQLANDEKEAYPLASQIAINDFYMDDLLSGSDNLDEAREKYTQITKMMLNGGFKMQKWTSNDNNFLKYIERAEENTKETYVINNDDVIKTLGIKWNRVTDKFQYIINLNYKTSETKRTILSTIARIYDPMGWLAPVIVTAKVFIQKLWLAGISWDHPIPKILKDEWIKYEHELKDVKDITVNRWINTNNTDTPRELHGYSDASTMAYAATVYLRVVKRDGQILTSLITAKTKVAPTKTISVPRLELCGAVLLTNLLNEVAEQLKINRENIYAYTDSKVVLAWLQCHPSRWKTFIANRTSEILSLLPSQHWHHVSSGNNPADVASRGATPLQLKTHSLWWTGPEDLKQKNLKHKKLIDNITNLEEKTIKVMTTIQKEQEFNLFEKYSKLTKLLRVTAYILRFIRKKKVNHKHLIGEEIERSMEKCILICQQQEYSNEIQNLTKNKPISSNSKLKTLNPFLDKNRILRVGGRLAHANIPDGSKHQIILPGSHPFTKLILQDCHEKTLHGGPMLMLSHLRTKFWIAHAKSLLREVLHKCVTCTRYRSATATQMMGSLPRVRVTPARPFLNSGVDLAGPIDLRLSKGRGCKTQKGYIIIFICMVTRAIHIEIVTSLTSKDFVAAFKRFVARRGRCKNIWSDNATNLTAGNKDLMSAFERSIDTVRAEIEDLLANDGTTWHHIPALAPHFGGLWEAGVKSIKFHLKRILQNTTLTYEEMSTLTAQIEATLNSRPISPMSDDPSDYEPLTPGHFLIGEAPITVPEESHLDKHFHRLERWQRTQRMMQDFWARWSREYLSRLQQRPKWIKTKPNIKIGELVLLKEDNMPPGKWLMARVIDTHPGDDELTRVITVKTKTSVLRRPVTKVCRLPIDD